MKQRRQLTLDRKKEPEIRQGRFYTTEQLGPKQSMTPEGFLLCEDVPLARSGEMLYGPDETPIGDDGSGVVRISRTDAELFRPETIASFNGKSICNEHPPDDVLPKNWKNYEKGVILNPRKGEGGNEGLLVGDFLIKDPEMISDVRAGKREVSLGYDADYIKTGPGKGEQTNILGNHVALVERGRCGPRCAIHDHTTTDFDEDLEMPIANTQNSAARRRLDSLTVRKVLDKALLDMEKMEGGEQEKLSKDEEGEYGKNISGSGMQHIHIHMEGSTAPSGKTGAITTNSNSEDDGEYPSGPEFPENKNEGNDPNRMRADAKDDPYEPRFRKIEDALGSILEHLKGSMGGGQQQEATSNSREDYENGDKANDDMTDPEAEEYAEEVSDSAEYPEELKAGEKSTKDKIRKVRDSAQLEPSWRNLRSDAEVLVPGFRVPTLDTAAHPVDTLYALCRIRKRALDSAYMTADGKNAIDQVMRGRAFDSDRMDCRCLRRTFDAAVAVRRAINNAPSRTSDTDQPVVQAAYHSPNAFHHVGPVQSIEQLSALYKDVYRQGKQV